MTGVGGFQANRGCSHARCPSSWGASSNRLSKGGSGIDLPQLTARLRDQPRLARRAGDDPRPALSVGLEKACRAARIESRSAALVDLYRSLVRIDSTNPPGDTTAMVEAVLDAADDGIEHRRVVGRAPTVNLVARVRGAGPGRRLVLNGHLDTFLIGEARWSHPPLGGDLADGRIYGRGACDMKAGVAALVLAFVTVAEFRKIWNRELVLTLIGDEETGGR